MRVAASDVVATVDPTVEDATFRELEQIPLGDYDSALVCTPDDSKLALLRFLLANGKNVLVEKPLLLTQEESAELNALARQSGVVAYTAYNHRFEPHLMRVRDILASQSLGKISMVSMYYGNGTARDVRNSPWRDRGLGVIADLGSHMLDLVDYWFPAGESSSDLNPELQWAQQFENLSYDAFSMSLVRVPTFVQIEGSLLSWRNTFRLDVIGEDGSVHVDGLCKWGPSILRVRERVLPSGRPNEQEFVLEQPDPTWEAEYEHFRSICRSGDGGGFQSDVAVSKALRQVERQLSDRAS